MKAKEIEEEIYGEDGLYKRIIDETLRLNKDKGRQAQTILGLSTQHLYEFRKQFEKEPRQTKIKTLLEYAEKLGIE